MVWSLFQYSVCSEIVCIKVPVTPTILTSEHWSKLKSDNWFQSVLVLVMLFYRGKLSPISPLRTLCAAKPLNIQSCWFTVNFAINNHISSYRSAVAPKWISKYF